MSAMHKYTYNKQARGEQLLVRGTVALLAPQAFGDDDDKDEKPKSTEDFLAVLIGLAGGPTSTRQKHANRVLWQVAQRRIAASQPLDSPALAQFVATALEGILTGKRSPQSVFRVARGPGRRKSTDWRVKEDAYFLVDYYHRAGLEFGRAIQKVIDEEPDLKDVLERTLVDRTPVVRPADDSPASRAQSALREAIRRYRKAHPPIADPFADDPEPHGKARQRRDR